VSCLADAAGDKELSRSGTRAVGFTSFGPGFMALGMFLFVAILVETRAGLNMFSLVLIVTILMGTYVILAACMLPGLFAAKETAAACDAPFQSQLPQL